MYVFYCQIKKYVFLVHLQLITIMTVPLILLPHSPMAADGPANNPDNNNKALKHYCLKWRAVAQLTLPKTTTRSVVRADGAN